jgi:hypothetical protein
MSSTQRYSPSPLSTHNNNTIPVKTTSSPFQQRIAPQKKRIMSVTQTYYLAHKARAKLSAEAARADHDLRLLVGHANLLDSLMLELADAEREQESWFNQSVRGATEERAEKKDRHIQWADAIVEDPEEDWHADDADSYSDSSDSSSEYDSEDDDEDVDMADVVSLRRLPSAKPASGPLLAVAEDEYSDDDDMEEDDLEEDYAQLELVRTSSHNTSSPPELVQHDLDEDSSDDESAMPPSPPNTILTFSEKEAKESSMQQRQDRHPDAFFLPRKNAPATSIVSAISVY